MSIFIHKSNIENKIKNNYNNKRIELQSFYSDVYLETHRFLLEQNYSKDDTFSSIISKINTYLNELDVFSDKNKINSQSKFRSTFLEELSEYLFKDLEPIKSGRLGFYNKKIYAGLKIGADMKVSVIHKDVDFCIGKEVSLNIDGNLETIIMPVVAVEVKTYLDATMFGEVQYSARLIKNAVPNARIYVLMEYNDVAKEKIIAARHDNSINEMFALRCKGDKNRYNFDFTVLENYYKEIKDAITNLRSETVNDHGRLLDRKVIMWYEV